MNTQDFRTSRTHFSRSLSAEKSWQNSRSADETNCQQIFRPPNATVIGSCIQRYPFRDNSTQRFRSLDKVAITGRPAVATIVRPSRAGGCQNRTLTISYGSRNGFTESAGLAQSQHSEVTFGIIYTTQRPFFDRRRRVSEHELIWVKGDDLHRKLP